MKALEQAAAEKLGRNITLIGYLYADNILTLKELITCMNQARIMFISEIDKAEKEGADNG